MGSFNYICFNYRQNRFYPNKLKRYEFKYYQTDKITDNFLMEFTCLHFYLLKI